MLNELLGSSLAHELIVVLISTLPVAELRGALPVAIGVFHMPWHEALALSIMGNLIPATLLLFFFDRFIKWAIKGSMLERKVVSIAGRCNGKDRLRLHYNLERPHGVLGNLARAGFEAVE